MSEARKSAAAPQVAAETVETGLLDQIVEQGRLARDPASRERGKNLVKEFVSQVLEGAMTVSKDAEAMINARIAQIDHLVSLQLNEVMHNPLFQKLEGSWRGLKFLLDHSETSDRLKIKMFNVTKKELLRDLQRAPDFDSSEYAKWKSFRQSEDSRYIGLTLPHILMRLPYGKGGVSVDGFNYEEGVDGTEHSKYLWGNAAYALGTRLTAAHAEYGWCAAIRGVEGGGLVEGLPTHNFTTDAGDVALKCPTESPVTDRREKELADLGFIPLVHCKDTDYAAFFSVQSAQKPKLYDKEAANANARLSTQLPYILAMSRFAHYLKAIMRDKIGSFMSRDDCQRFLHTWIQQYVVGDDNASQAVKAKNPLREARVEVVDVPGKPGAYRAVCFLRPHFQLDELSVSLRLVADLPEGGK
jgi:type VI secretion system protein ImpC